MERNDLSAHHEKVLVVSDQEDMKLLSTPLYFLFRTLVISKEQWESSPPVQTDAATDEAAIYGAVDYDFDKGK
jgi:hypothetical protein